MSTDALRDLAVERELALSEGGDVRALTPALLPGAGGGVVARATGTLAPGLEGTAFLLGGKAGETTVILTKVHGSSAFVPAMVCRDRGAAGAQRPAELPAERWEPTELESVGFNRRYALLALHGQDPGLVRELFSPRLIAWLEREPPPGFSFELNEGNLTVAMPGHLGGEDLRRLCALAAEVSSRVQAEIDEEGELDPDVYDESVKLEAIEKGMAEVDWDEPPASVGDAIAAYRRVARRKPSVLASALMWAVIAGGVVTVPLAIAVHPIVGLLLGLVFAPIGLLLGWLVATSRYRWGGTASVSRVGLEAFARGYAASRGLRLENRWRFHAAHRDLAVPGFADHVFAGELPGTEGLEGRLLMLGDAAEMRALGQEIAYTSDRPLASSALLVEAPRDLPEGAADRVDLPDEYKLQVSGRSILVWRPVTGNLLRTAAGSDRFCANAGAVARSVLGAARPA